jgi:hypothetical protein
MHSHPETSLPSTRTASQVMEMTGYGGAMPGQECMPSQSEASVQHAALQDTCDSLERIVGELEKRLDPVLKQEPGPVMPAKPCDPHPMPNSYIGGAFNDRRAQVAGVNGRLQEIIRRLAV